MFCMECGTELPENAKFCFNCGAKVERTAVSEPAGRGSTVYKPAAPAPKPKAAAHIEAEHEEQNDSAALAKLFASLDPVVCHSEYYYLSNGNPMLCGYSMAINGKWVLKHISHFPDDEYLLIDENGESTIKLDVRPKLRKSEYKNLIGFNNLGVWFFVRSQFNERFLNEKFICVDVVKNRTYEYLIEHKHGAISDIYIYGDELYYINDTADFKQYLHRLLPSGNT
ncbi:MAG: zinc ribbon domain-containing protein, partial [Oscillospiraceae bacterium]|nr:zinc ribbon domain-containing protein [Oscillospiraceae bacterium]